MRSATRLTPSAGVVQSLLLGASRGAPGPRSCWVRSSRNGGHRCKVFFCGVVTAWIGSDVPGWRIAARAGSSINQRDVSCLCCESGRAWQDAFNALRNANEGLRGRPSFALLGAWRGAPWPLICDWLARCFSCKGTSRSLRGAVKANPIASETMRQHNASWSGHSALHAINAKCFLRCEITTLFAGGAMRKRRDVAPERQQVADIHRSG